MKIYFLRLALLAGKTLIYPNEHEGDAPIIGFSPRKAAFSLYVYAETKRSEELLVKLGKFKMAKVCMYIKKL